MKNIFVNLKTQCLFSWDPFPSNTFRDYGTGWFGMQNILAMLCAHTLKNIYNTVHLCTYTVWKMCSKSHVWLEWWALTIILLKLTIGKSRCYWLLRTFRLDSVGFFSSLSYCISFAKRQSINYSTAKWETDKPRKESSSKNLKHKSSHLLGATLSVVAKMNWPQWFDDSVKTRMSTQHGIPKETWLFVLCHWA